MSVGPVLKPAELAMVDNAIMVPPVSLRLLEKHKMIPVTNPALNKGRVMVLTAVSLLAPRVCPAISYVSSICSRIAAKDRTM